MVTRPIVLASASPRRRELLMRLGRQFTVAPAHIDETPRSGETPYECAVRLAMTKARVAAGAAAKALGGTGGREAAAPEPLALGADTVVVLDGAALGKPVGPDEAINFLQRLRGREHEVATAVALADPASGRVLVGLDRTRVWMRDYTEAEIRDYVASGDAADKAGAYAIQSPSFAPVARIEGSYWNVVGLPLDLTSRLLAAFEAPASTLDDPPGRGKAGRGATGASSGGADASPAGLGARSGGADGPTDDAT